MFIRQNMSEMDARLLDNPPYFFILLRVIIGLVQITKYKVLSLTHTQTTISISLTSGNIKQLRNPSPLL